MASLAERTKAEGKKLRLGPEIVRGSFDVSVMVPSEQMLDLRSDLGIGKVGYRQGPEPRDALRSAEGQNLFYEGVRVLYCIICNLKVWGTIGNRVPDSELHAI